jgi:hypothetical protein
MTTVAAHARAAEREALIPLLHCTDLLRMAGAGGQALRHIASHKCVLPDDAVPCAMHMAVEMGRPLPAVVLGRDRVQIHQALIIGGRRNKSSGKKVLHFGGLVNCSILAKDLSVIAHLRARS